METLNVTHRRLVVCADDFGLDTAINEAVESAHRDGILTCTSLMMGEDAVPDAVKRAHRLPSLGVGLHITLTAGHSVLPAAQIPDLVDAARQFENNMGMAGVRYFFLPRVRNQLEAEIRAQFEAFRATGLKLDHVNAHRHFHLHPTLASMLLNIGRDYGMKAMRVPYEPTSILNKAAAPDERYTTPIYAPWAWLLGARLRHAGITTNHDVLGLVWSGNMVEQRILSLLPHLREGVTELYFHPAVERTDKLKRLMPDYHHVEEYQALTSPLVKQMIADLGIQTIPFAKAVAA